MNRDLEIHTVSSRYIDWAFTTTRDKANLNCHTTDVLFCNRSTQSLCVCAEESTSLYIGLRNLSVEGGRERAVGPEKRETRGHTNDVYVMLEPNPSRQGYQRMLCTQRARGGARTMPVIYVCVCGLRLGLRK